MILTPDELAELTGYASARGQRGWLDAQGWVYATARDGSPRVARQYFLHKMGVPQDGVAHTGRGAPEPNWSAI